jgi:hypothetical protein
MHFQVPRKAVDMAQLEQDRDLCGLVRAREDASADSATKAKPAGALGNLASRNNADRAAVLAASAIPLLVELVELVELLRGGSEAGKAKAAGALHTLTSVGGDPLHNYTSDDANKQAVAEVGPIPLVELLRGGSDASRAT